MFSTYSDIRVDEKIFTNIFIIRENRGEHRHQKYQIRLSNRDYENTKTEIISAVKNLLTWIQIKNCRVYSFFPVKERFYDYESILTEEIVVSICKITRSLHTAIDNYFASKQIELEDSTRKYFYLGVYDKLDLIMKKDFDYIKETDKIEPSERIRIRLLNIIEKKVNPFYASYWRNIRIFVPCVEDKYGGKHRIPISTIDLPKDKENRSKLGYYGVSLKVMIEMKLWDEVSPDGANVAKYTPTIGAIILNQKNNFKE